LSLGLAPMVVEQLLGAVESIRGQGTTVILVEQSVNLALTVADRAVFMEKGEVRFSGPAADLLDRPDILRSVYLHGADPRAGSGPRDASLGPAAAPTAARSPSAGAATVLDADDLWVTYGGVHALRGAGVSVAAGEIVGLIGPNGAGTTTLFDVVAGF